ncbi:uncharacterized protein LOC108022055 [Drosophila biarmipes]|uniref:uncharacterized protein LOC108022055 n=1 Tax=Drosophila biarmipes TaxID=125945 RepID=UPI0007E825AF|nr:uncharacterized protein LOC108022055 [Drosophila biarmipes]
MRKVSIVILLLVSGVASSMEHLQSLKEFLEAVHQERAISTLLLLQKGIQRNDLLQDLYPLAWPVIRLNESQRIELVNHYNKEFLALVHMDSPEDVVLLSALAANLNHIREARIVIWLELQSSEDLLKDFSRASVEHKFLNLLVIEKSLQVQRLFPHPEPKFQVIEKPFEEKEIFPVLWSNFMGKVAVTMPDMVPPRSFISTDPKTGRQRARGCVYQVFRNFARRHNITLELHSPLNQTMLQTEIIEKTIGGEIDLPITGQFMNFRHPNGSRMESILGMTAMSIAVPCGEELSMVDRFQVVCGNASIIISLTSYILLNIVDVVLQTLNERIHQNPTRFELLNVFLNLRVFRCVLSMSIPMGNRLRSFMGQLTMVMSFTGLILASIAAAQISTVLTMSPQYRHITNFQELRDSNITVVFTNLNYQTVKMAMQPGFVSHFMPNIWIVSGTEQIKMLSDLNTSYAYQTYSYKNDVFSALQRHSKRKALCRSPELDLVSGLAYSAVLQQNSIYALALRDYMYKIWSSGLISYWLDEAIAEHRSIMQGKLLTVNDYDALSLRDYKGGWQVLLVGCTLSFCVFIGEILVHKVRGRLYKKK